MQSYYSELPSNFWISPYLTALRECAFYYPKFPKAVYIGYIHFNNPEQDAQCSLAVLVILISASEKMESQLPAQTWVPLHPHTMLWVLFQEEKFIQKC